MANYAALDVRPARLGNPLPGIEAAVVRHVDDGVEVITEPNVRGRV